ncbi:DUF551 domain-containing protein [Azorhizophilus paspali]|uniref:DUF551 domain-containing protein n=1 Tax=Azorhizophilus paspali TaxID=69963 RepID=UPI003D3BCAC3
MGGTGPRPCASPRDPDGIGRLVPWIHGGIMKSDWVPVSERLPAPDDPVLAYNGRWIGVAAWRSGEFLEDIERWQDEHREMIGLLGPAVTHWMPLPPAPGDTAAPEQAEQQEVVMVSRELLERLARTHAHDDHWDAIDELRAMLAGSDA